MGTCFSSSRIEAMLGNIPFRWVMTTRGIRAEVVFLRSEANRVNPSINSSVKSQFANARVFSEGEAEGFDNKLERRCDKSVPDAMNVSMAGKNDR